MQPVKLMLVDDQDLIRESLQIVLDMDPEIEVVALADNGLTAVEQCEIHRPDVILMDIRMPGMDGVEATRLIKQKHPETKIIMLTTFQEVNYVVEALSAGAEGYLLKAIRPNELASGVKWVRSGGTLIPQDIAQLLVSQLKRGEPVEPQQPASHSHKDEPYGLSERETQVLQCISEGMSNKEIAKKLFLTEGTVKNYISGIYSKLNVRDRLQASLKARDERLI